MLAYFYQNEFFGVWQDQENEPDWTNRTIKALGHNKTDVVIKKFPSQPNVQSYYFDANKDLILVNQEVQVVEGEELTVNVASDPIEGELIFNGTV
jgi:hypothetical protein